MIMMLAPLVLISILGLSLSSQAQPLGSSVNPSFGFGGLTFDGGLAIEIFN